MTFNMGSQWQRITGKNLSLLFVVNNNKKKIISAPTTDSTGKRIYFQFNFLITIEIVYLFFHFLALNCLVANNCYLNLFGLVEYHVKNTFFSDLSFINSQKC